MLLKTFLTLFVSALALLAEDAAKAQPKQLTGDQRAEIALALATYQEARAAAAEAQVRMMRAQAEVEALIKARTPEGHKLNGQLQLEKIEVKK